VIGLFLLFVLCALRLPWLEADGGNDAGGAYGLFTTDEGWNTSGGRMAFLTGHFLDPELNEPLNFLTSWGMHVLSYLGYCVAGLSLAAVRWPTMIAAICGWLSAFVLVSRRTSAPVAGVVVLLMSCNPLSLTYERVVSTDVIVGSLSVLALTLATSRREWLAAAAGVVMAAALSVKPTALLFIPMIVLVVGMKRHDRVRRFILIGASFLVVFGASVAFRQACIRSAAGVGGTGAVVQALSIETVSPSWLTHQFSDYLKAIFIFPRCPTSQQFGTFILWCFALPALAVLLSWFRTGRLLSRKIAIPLGVLLYLAVFSISVTSPLRYLLPALYLAPVLIVDARALALRNRPVSLARWAIAALVIAALFALYWLHPSHTPQQLQNQLYNEFTTPTKGPWLLMGIPLAAGFLLLTFALHFCMPGCTGIKSRAMLCGFSLITVWWFFNNYTVSLMIISGMFIRSQLVFQFSLCALSVALFVGRSARRWQWWYLLQAAIFAAFLMGNGLWSSAYRTLWVRHFQTRAAAQKFANVVQADSIVIGRRATALLRTTRARLGITTSGYQPKDFAEKVAFLLDKYPTQPLYWLVDGDGNSFWQWDAYQKWGLNRWKVTPVATAYIASGDVFSMRDMPDTGEMPVVPIYLMRVTKLP
jgi:hypothetical protein